VETFVYKDKRNLRCGYTTGTCAALAARAAAFYLAAGIWKEEEEILTPKGTRVRAKIVHRHTEGGCAVCSVKKDAGDDYDVTDGLLITASVMFLKPDGNDGAFRTSDRIFIEGGPGVGRVTKAGLDQPVGASAINSVPRAMISEAVREVLEKYGCEKDVKVVISVPKGEEAAKKTFNPVLGIEGGISILGTSGIVEPMSEEALTDTIRAHMQVLRAEGRRYAILAPGNMGENFIKQYLGTKRTPPVVVISNFVGKSIDMAGELGFSGVVLAGHIGKLVKLGNGIMNTHSREGDGRMDTLLSCGLTAGADRAALCAIQKANTTEEALSILRGGGVLNKTMEVLCERINGFVKRRAMDSLKTGVMVFDTGAGLLGTTENAKELIKATVAEEVEKTEEKQEAEEKREKEEKQEAVKKQAKEVKQDEKDRL